MSNIINFEDYRHLNKYQSNNKRLKAILEYKRSVISDCEIDIDIINHYMKDRDILPEALEPFISQLEKEIDMMEEINDHIISQNIFAICPEIINGKLKQQ